MKKFYLMLLGASALLSSCDKNNQPAGKYTEGVFILNEGNFQAGNGTMTYLNRETNTATIDVFGLENSGAQLGNVPMGMSVHNGKAYIPVNNSDKIAVLDANTMAFVGEVAVQQPRNFLAVDGAKGYATYWEKGANTGGIAVVDLATRTVTKYISTGGNSTEGIIRYGNKIYVTSIGNNSGTDNRIFVINPTTDIIETNFAVENFPAAMVLDNNNFMWVYCRGTQDWNTSTYTNAHLMKINLGTNAIVTDIDLGASEYSNASILATNRAKDKIFLLFNGDVYSISSSFNGTALPAAVIAPSFEIYSIGIDKSEGDRIYISNARDYSSEGVVYRYDNAMNIVDSLSSGGVTPGGFYFSE